MNQMLILLPLALCLGMVGLVGFLWAVRSGQFDDLDGDALRILIDDEPAAEPDPSDGGPPAPPRAPS